VILSMTLGTTFVVVARTIGHDNDLRYFALSDYDRYEMISYPSMNSILLLGRF